MYEFLAVACGVALGLAWHRLETRFRIPLAACGGVVSGVAVAWASGELGESWSFALFDTAQALAAAAITAASMSSFAARRRTR